MDDPLMSALADTNQLSDEHRAELAAEWQAGLDEFFL